MTYPVLTLEPGRPERHYWLDLWRYRELFLILAWRDVAVRYKQTVIGVAWALIRPALTMLAFTLVFGKLARLPSEGSAPYPVMVFAGMLPWFLFASTLTAAAESIVVSANLIGKVYFPRAIIPTSTALVGLVDLVVSLAVLAVVMVWYGFVPGWQIFLLPVFVALTLAASLGPALWVSAVNAKYRDFRHVVPFLVQLGLYVSPVGFSSTIVPDQWRWLYSLNPMVGIIDGFRWCLLGGQTTPYLPGIWISIAMTALLLWIGITRFRATEKQFADLV